MSAVRLIDANELKRAFEKVYPLATNEMGGVANKRIYEIIDNAPTVEGYKNVIVGGMSNPYNAGYMDGVRQAYKEVERPQGEWIENSLTIEKPLNCSICGAKPRQSVYGYYLHDNFCPSCGADMRKDGEEE